MAKAGPGSRRDCAVGKDHRFQGGETDRHLDLTKRQKQPHLQGKCPVAAGEIGVLRLHLPVPAVIQNHLCQMPLRAEMKFLPPLPVGAGQLVALRRRHGQGRVGEITRWRLVEGKTDQIVGGQGQMEQAVNVFRRSHAPVEDPCGKIEGADLPLVDRRHQHRLPEKAEEFRADTARLADQQSLAAAQRVSFSLPPRNLGQTTQAGVRFFPLLQQAEQLFRGHRFDGRGQNRRR